MNTPYLIFFLLLIAVKSVAAKSTTLNFEEYATQKMEEHKIVGASIGTIESGRLSDVLYLGFESSVTKVPVNKRSVFQVGSISKPVAAWVVMTLVRDGKLELDEPVSRYLRRWNIPQSNFDSQQVTLRQLLSHTAGFRLGGYGGFPEGQSLPTLEESLSGNTNGSGKVELFQKPGLSFSYSGGGYTLIQLLVEEASGMSFSEYSQLAVLRPLEMIDSSYEPSEALLKRRIQPYTAFSNPLPQHDFRAQAAASLHTTVIDLARFLQANLKENSVLNKDEIAMMHSPIADAGFADIGLGFFISEEGRLVGHQGANFGWRAEIQFDPKTNDGLVVVTNSDGANQFLVDIKCQWDARREEPVLTNECNTRKSRIELAKTIVYCSLCFFCLAISALIWALLTTKVRFSLPRTSSKLLGLISTICVTLFFVVFMYTPLGVYLVAGFKSITATIVYAPPFVAVLTPWMCALLLTAWLPFFFERIRKEDRKENPNNK